MPVPVRLARPADVPGVLALWNAARSPVAVTEDRAEDAERLIDLGALLVAEEDGRIAGALVAAWDGWRGNMYRLAVLPEARRRGIARALVDAGHEALRAKGARRVSALVADEEAEATALWAAVGYARDGQLARWVRNL
ncbi:MAG: GNAT family N-acetyltransferase [Solirubrobacterales bacterium]|nr:GNAT family N-acetyltransferase [Solirubrobacterales bacterium]